jgi:hypothetical protein
MSDNGSGDYTEMVATITERLIALAKSEVEVTERAVYDIMGVGEWPAIGADELIKKILEALDNEQAVLDETTNVRAFEKAVDGIYDGIKKNITQALCKESACKLLWTLESAIVVSSVQVKLNGTTYSVVESNPRMNDNNDFPDFQSLESFLNTDPGFQALEANCENIDDLIRAKAKLLTTISLRRLIDTGALDEFSTQISRLLAGDLVPMIQNHLSEVHWPRARNILGASFAGIVPRFKTFCTNFIRDVLEDFDIFPVYNWQWLRSEASNHRARIYLKYQASLAGQAPGNQGINSNNGSLPELTLDILTQHWQLCTHISKKLVHWLISDDFASLGRQYGNDFLDAVLRRTDDNNPDVVHDIVDAPYLARSPGFEHAYQIRAIMVIVQNMKNTAPYAS